jgi:plasmid maintenance system antidote protein VapI
MKAQELLLKTIRNLIPKDISLNDELAKTLDISYDAAHRRVSGKTKFSIDETIQLCAHYDIAMDNLFKKEEKYILEKTKTIHSVSDFKLYLEKSAALLDKFKNNNSTVYYSAKDIPLHYTIGGSLLSKFKIYVWLNILTSEQNLSFENFKIEESLLQESSALISIFENANRIEIWNDTTINSSLQQLFYFYEAGLLLYENALIILEDIRKIIISIETKTQNNHPNFELFYNELLVLNNTVLFTNEKKSSFFIPHNMLSYYVNTDKISCNEEKNFISNQLKNSKSISKAGKKDQKIFFNRMHQKIEFYKTKIESYVME